MRLATSPNLYLEQASWGNFASARLNPNRRKIWNKLLRNDRKSDSSEDASYYDRERFRHREVEQKNHVNKEVLLLGSKNYVRGGDRVGADEEADEKAGAHRGLGVRGEA